MSKLKVGDKFQWSYSTWEILKRYENYVLCKGTGGTRIVYVCANISRDGNDNEECQPILFNNDSNSANFNLARMVELYDIEVEKIKARAASALENVKAKADRERQLTVMGKKINDCKKREVELAVKLQDLVRKQDIVDLFKDKDFKNISLELSMINNVIKYRRF